MRKLLIGLMCLLIAAGTLAGCSGNTQQTSAPGVPVAVEVAVLRGPTAVGAIDMISNYDGSKDGMKITYSVEQDPNTLSGKLSQGNIAMATLPTNTAAVLYNKTGGKYILAGVNTWGVMYVVSTDGQITSWADLKGKTVDTGAKSSPPDMVFKYVLKANGIDPDKDLTLKYVAQPSEQSALIAAGESSISFMAEPWVTNALSKNSNAKVALNFQDEWARVNQGVKFPQTCVVINAEFARNNPQLVEKLLAAFAASVQWVNQNPAEAGKLIAARKDIGLDANIAAAAIPRCNLDFKPAKDSKADIAKYLEVLKDFSADSIGGKMPDEGFYYQK